MQHPTNGKQITFVRKPLHATIFGKLVCMQHEPEQITYICIYIFNNIIKKEKSAVTAQKRKKKYV